MHRLSDDAESILDIVRDADDPTERDRRRLAGAMAARLGAAAMVSTATVGVSSSVGAGAGVTAGGVGSAVAGAGVVTKVLASIALVGAVGGGVALHHARAPLPSPVLISRESIAAGAPSARVDVAPVVESHAAPAITEKAAIEPPHVVAAPRAKERMVSSAPSRLREPAPPVEGTSRADMLAREVSVLASARAALLDHEPARALALLDANSATFAAGMLREEFLVARILALRDLGRTVEADALAAKFAKEMSHSPLAAELTVPESTGHSKDAHDH